MAGLVGLHHLVAEALDGRAGLALLAGVLDEKDRKPGEGALPLVHLLDTNTQQSNQQGKAAENEKGQAAKADPITRQEVRYKGKTYGVGEQLPANMEKEARDRLKELGAIE